MISVLGLITSKPEKEIELISPYNQPVGDEEENRFSIALKNMFPASEGFEKILKGENYPRIIVEPIAIYRDL